MRDEERASMLLAGGILQRGYQCGIIWGSVLTAGARAHDTHGPGPRAETAAISAAQRLVERFREENRHINCLEITELDASSSPWKMIKFFIFKGGTIGCIRRAIRFSRTALTELSSPPPTAIDSLPGQSVSCATMVARKMGATDRQATMAAGFAGGIGLCGGACGALGAAVWMIALNSIRKQDGKVSFDNARASDAIEKFLDCTGHTFECSEIVGRKFESVEDHAAYIREGGCAAIIDTLSRCGT